MSRVPEGPARLTQVVPISGTSTNGKRQFTGTYTIERFINKGGKVYSVGTVKGKLGNRRVTKDNVRMPAAVRNASGTAKASQVQPPPLPLPPLPTGNACSILALDLGPINLNLLGLVDPVPTGSNSGSMPSKARATCSATCSAGSRGSSTRARLASTPLGQLTQILNALLALFAAHRVAATSALEKRGRAPTTTRSGLGTSCAQVSLRRFVEERHSGPGCHFVEITASRSSSSTAAR